MCGCRGTNKDGSIVALKIHLYYLKAKKTAGAHG